MTAEANSGKICVVCGQDCANKPRIKDSHGRYYCKACHEQAQKRAHAQNDRPARKPPRAGAAAGDQNEGDSLLSEILPVAAPPPVLRGQSACPGCSMAVPYGALICTNCGLNLQTGKAVTVSKARPAKAKSTAHRGAAWPIVVGVISIIFGAGGTLLYGYQLLMAALAVVSAGVGLPGMIGLASGALPMLLALWLLRDGIGIVQRNSTAATRIRWWAGVKIAVFGTCLGILLLMLNNASDRDFQSAAIPIEVNMAALKMYIALWLAWICAWPLFILIWFSIPAIQAQVADWD